MVAWSRMDVLDILRALFEIIVLWVIFYQLYRVFKGSRAAAILGGLVIIMLFIYFLVDIIHASVLQRIVGAIIPIGTILVIVFQTEIRTALAKLGSSPLLHGLMQQHGNSDTFILRVCDSVSYLTSKRFGALIAIARKDNLHDVVSNATRLDAIYTRELVGTIFMPKTLLHDGAVIVNHERVEYASAILPVSDRELKDASLGLRHRAGIGLAEKSDAVVIIVSEETGTISLAVGNALQRNLSLDLLRERLKELLYAQDEESPDQEPDHTDADS